jgi:dipeptidyl aminopeptidase/acylaminoacyl peptidase
LEESEQLKKREELYGKFAADDSELRYNRLMLLNFEPKRLGQMPLPSQLNDSIVKASEAPRAVLDSLDFYINNFLWSPDGSRISIEHQPNSLLLSFLKADISLYDVESDSLTPFIAHPTQDMLLHWSPTGEEILFTSTVADSTSSFYKNDRYFRAPLNGDEPVELASDFDENLDMGAWSESGIHAIGWQKTHRLAYRINPADGKVTPIHNDHKRILNATYSKDGNRMAYLVQENDGLPEVYISDSRLRRPQKITDFTTQIEDWAYADSDMICWQSKDGTRIEGVLSKPMDYDPEKKYPLLVIIHGGPTGISVPRPADAYVYPMLQWLNKGALVLMPNYRGSAGYGEEFRSLNVRNLGVGDAWDVISGVEYLIDQGMVDADKVGCMGWSQGGYISAFLTTHSDIFKAVSVGAGISNWITYYVSTDIHPFTRQYLKATPWSDPEIYSLTSPMTKINEARTPTLIQHGEFDKRVPVPNAYELYQGLQDVGVESELYIYKGFGHGINKPKERLAATWHNWQWFSKYLWGEEVELPGLE